MGLLLQVARFMAGVVHELMVELNEDQTKAIDSPEFQRILRDLTSQARDSWRTLLGVARGDTKASSNADSYSKMLVFVRNTVAFHYSDKILARGYREHFSDASRPHSSRALFSDGRAMEDTRFFFADAAAEQGLASTGMTTPEVLKRIAALAGQINLALKPIVMAHIRSFPTSPYETTWARAETPLSTTA
jgi:hypothetical protein